MDCHSAENHVALNTYLIVVYWFKSRIRHLIEIVNINRWISIIIVKRLFIKVPKIFIQAFNISYQLLNVALSMGSFCENVISISCAWRELARYFNILVVWKRSVRFSWSIKMKIMGCWCGVGPCGFCRTIESKQPKRKQLCFIQDSSKHSQGFLGWLNGCKWM